MPALLSSTVRTVLVLLLTTGSILGARTALAQRAETPAEDAFAEAMRLYADELYDPAVQHFAAFRTRYPDHVSAAEALYYQAEATLALGREDAAVALFEAFQQHYPIHPLAFQARLALGKYFYETQQYDRALATLERVLDDEPPYELAAKALYWMGESALNQDRYAVALGHFERAAEEYRYAETAPVALYAIAYTQIRRERYDDAARAFELLAARYPDSPYAQNLGLALAEVYYELGDYGRAISEIERRLPNVEGEVRERATFLLAESHNQLRNSADAIVYYRRFTEGNPESPYYRRALYGLAWNYHFEGTYQWAAETFAEVRAGHDDDLAAQAAYYQAVNLKLAERPMLAAERYRDVALTWPNHELAPHALYERGVALYEQRLWEEANEAFARLVETYPESDLLGDALSMLGNTHIAVGDFDAALEAFDRAIALDAAPASLKQEVVFQRAWLQYRNEQYAAAAPTFLELYEDAPDAEKADQALFWAAESFFQQGALDRAAALFRQYLRTYPGGDQVDAAHYALGWVHFKQARYAEAAREFETFLEAYRAGTDYVPYRTDALLRLADSYYALKRFPEAIRVYTRVAAEGEDYALYQIGQALSNTGDTFEAISTFRDLLTEYSGSEWRDEAQYSLGYLYFQNQDYDQAIEEYRTVVTEAPRSALAAKAQYGIGDAHFNAGRLEEAVRAYQRVLERYPSSPFAADAAAGIQYALVALDDEDRAEAIIDSFMVQNPDAPVVDELRFRRAEVQYQSGQVDEALRAFQSYVRTASNETLLPEAYFYLGSIYLDRQDPDAAEGYLRRVVDDYPESTRRAEAAAMLGRLYLEQERYRDALAVYRTLEAIRPDDRRTVAQARYGQSTALLKLGRTADAEALLQEALAQAPDAPESVPALLGLARVYEARGNAQRAGELYREVVDRSQDETGAEALVRLGELLVRQGQPQQAIEELGRLPVLYAGYGTWIAQGLLIQARAFTQLGQRGDASQLYDRILEQYPDTPYADLAEQEKAAL